MRPVTARGGAIAVAAVILAAGYGVTQASSSEELSATVPAAALAAQGAWSASQTYKKDEIVTARGSAWRSKVNNNKGKVPGSTKPNNAPFWEAFAVGFNPAGAWTSTRTYQPNELATRLGQTWRAKLTSKNSAPAANANWELWVTKGAAGAKGATGPAGPSTVAGGSAASPAIKVGDPDTGIFAPAAGKIALVENGTLFLHNLGVQTNTALGLHALSSAASTSQDNTAIGYGALQDNGSAVGNTAVGYFALRKNIAWGNTAVGNAALLENTTGDSNIAVGGSALFWNTTGRANTAVGELALSQNTTASGNTAVGYFALIANTTGANNSAVGTSALQKNSTGVQNSALGNFALADNTIGYNNTAVGVVALQYNTTGVENSALGSFALRNNKSGTNNSAFGYQALAANTTGGSNTAVGDNALLSNTTGPLNTAVGSLALIANTIGQANTALGRTALRDNTEGSLNTAVGTGTLANNTTGVGNTAVGQAALASNETGSYNIAIGASAGIFATTPSISIFIGNDGLADDTETIKIGTSQTSTFIAGINGQTSTGGTQVFINGDGQLGTNSSSRRYKDNIQSIGDPTAMLHKLRPVTFHYKKPDTDGSKPTQYGLIAEEVEAVSRDLAHYSKDGSIETVKYHFLPPLLLAGWQAQQKTIAAQADEIVDLKARLARIEALLPQTKAASLQ